ncbi:NAD(P)/FAD-dependent oxidoreductase, partial [Agathobaculum sp. Marseille-P7918]|uniref:NAD(P)/FAD-dependent oxidoreductase n=1 Tax=Agathobaculum sp. Marseille-P7918 TaxID=2479843 RepID=UPI0035690B3B
PLCDTVLETLAAHGAPVDIVKKAKPHVGTDILKNVVRAMRREIIQNGGEVRFHTRLTGVSVKNGTLRGIQAGGDEIACERAVLAIGHSARDTFDALHQNGVYFEPKAFSVGVRIEHLQSEMDRALYGKYAGHPLLPPAEYNLSRREGGRACYSFCMCPGGVVVAAQSEEHTVVTNGMSYHARDGKNANSALAVSVDPADFDDGTPFGGVALQRRIERAAFAQTGSYRAPCQRVGDFLAGQPSTCAGVVQPSYPLGVQFGEAAACLPSFAQDMLRDSLPYFGRKIRGFDAADALLTGPETRTSSPVRMKRGDDLFGLGCAGMIPCGEGAGYAGGIMSAAVDGIRAAHRIMEEFQPFD